VDHRALRVLLDEVTTRRESPSDGMT